jgi:membrane protein YdbS with pleckstrin-like domain
MLDPRIIPLDRLVGAIVGVIIAGGHLIAIAILLLIQPWPWWALLLFGLSWIPMTTLLVWLAVKWPHIDYRHWRYRVDADGLEIWSGVVWRQAVMVPRSRVQHIDVSQGPLERSHGLATLSIHTAGTHHSKVDLRGLDHGVALAIRDALLPKDAEPAV